MRVAESRFGGFYFRQKFFCLVEFSQISTQDCVDETSLPGETGLFRKLDGFVDGGVVGDTVEPEKSGKVRAGGGFARRFVARVPWFFSR